MNNAFIIEFNDVIGKYQIKQINDILPKGEEIFFNEEDAEGVYIMKMIQANEEEREKYFQDPINAHAD